MEREFHGEWQRLEEQATAILMRPPVRDRYSSECHVVTLPSFDDGRAYTLMISGLNGPEGPLGIRRVWRRHVDLAKFDGPVIRLRYGPKLEPTIDQEDAPVGRQLVDGILERAANLRIPPYVREKTIGTDGVSYVVSFGGYFLATQLQWWCEPPAGWEDLAVLLHQVVDAVEGGLLRRRSA